MKASEVLIPLVMTGESESVLNRYRELVADGMAPRMAEIIASRSFPALGTDTEHYAGLPPLEQTAGVAYANKVKAEAKAAGLNISDGWRYNGTMADSRGGGDPRAWIGPGDGLQTYKDRLRETGGFSQDGSVAPDLGKIQEREDRERAALEKRKARKAERAMRMQERIRKGVVHS